MSIIYMKYQYNSRQYKIHRGERGGHYINVKGKKHYIKNQKGGESNEEYINKLFMPDGALFDEYGDFIVTNISLSDWDKIARIIREDQNIRNWTCDSDLISHIAILLWEYALDLHPEPGPIKVIEAIIDTNDGYLLHDKNLLDDWISALIVSLTMKRIIFGDNGQERDLNITERLLNKVDLSNENQTLHIPRVLLKIFDRFQGIIRSYNNDEINNVIQYIISLVRLFKRYSWIATREYEQIILNIMDAPSMDEYPLLQNEFSGNTIINRRWQQRIRKNNIKYGDLDVMTPDLSPDFEILDRDIMPMQGKPPGEYFYNTRDRDNQGRITRIIKIIFINWIKILLL
jgi:hypothetical protein